MAAQVVKLLAGGIIRVGDRDIPRKRRRDSTEDADRDYSDLYRFVVSAIHKLDAYQAKLTRISQLSSSSGIYALPLQGQAPSAALPSALAPAPQGERADPCSTSNGECTLTLFDPERLTTLGEDNDDDLLSPLSHIDCGSYLANIMLTFESWAHTVTLTDAEPFMSRTTGIDFPHKIRRDWAGKDGTDTLWVEAGRPMSVTARLAHDVNGANNRKSRGVSVSQILSEANKLLPCGERPPQELRFRAFVVDGTCTNPYIKATHTRPTTDHGCCVHVDDDNDGAVFTTLLANFERRNPREIRFSRANANNNTITFNDFRFRSDALSRRLSNSSNGSLRIVIAPEHPILKRLKSFYTISDEFKIGARIRPVVYEPNGTTTTTTSTSMVAAVSGDDESGSESDSGS
jgi:hypothetical protein